MKVVKILLVVVAVIAGAAAGVYFGTDLLGGQGKGAGTFRASTDAPSAVTALGRLEPMGEIIEVGAPAGSRIDELLVKEGDTVKKGAVLARLEAFAEMAAALTHAEEMHKEAITRRDAEVAVARAAITEAEEDIKQADEVMPLGIAAQEAEVKRCQAELAKVQLDLTRARQLLADRAMSQSAFDSVELTARQSEQMLVRGQQMLLQMQKDKEVKGAQARAKLVSAKAAEARAKVASGVDSLRVGVDVAKTRRDRAQVLAPADGEVLKINTKAGESVKGAILMLSNVAEMAAVAEVYETDIRHIAVGQVAEITSKALPGKKFTGKVVRVNKLVNKNDLFNTDPTAKTDARVVEVRIALDDSKEAARFNNLKVDVKIATK